MAESNTYVGNVTGTDIMSRSTYQTKTSGQLISKGVMWAAFTKNSFTKAIGVEGFGVEAMQNADALGSAKGTGRIIEMVTGHHSFAGQVFATTPTAFHVGRLGNFNPELVEGGLEYAYSWHRLALAEYIPDVDVQDNTAGRLIDIKAQKMSGMKQKFVESFNYAILGNSSAPDSGTMGPDSVDSDLPNLISVTQSGAVLPGNLSAANAAWKNKLKAITAIGGGGELDRPITLRRSLMKLYNDTVQQGEATEDYLLLASQGAWQYYDRLMYADSLTAGRPDAFGTLQRYDAASIRHKAFNGHPLLWDPAVTVPTGATASTESIYGIHIPSYKVSIRTEENFRVIDWEPPRAHDRQRTLVAMILLRYTPAVTQRRPHFVAYNLPSNPD